MARLAAAGGLGGGEGIDAGFAPDRRLADGEVVSGAGWRLEAVHTPGHLGDHLCFAWAEGGGAVLRRHGDGLGDDADLAARRRPRRLSARACAGCRRRGETVYLPGHGAPVRDPQAMIAWQLAHRAEREAQIRAALGAGPATIPQIVARVYPDLDPALRPAAARNVLAHLIDLVGRGLARSAGPLAADAMFEAA